MVWPSQSHSPKNGAFASVTPLTTTSRSSDRQSMKAPSPTYSTESGTTSSFRLTHPAKAYGSIAYTPSGTVAASNAGNAPMSPIVSNPSPANTTFVTAG